jgi:23S rRNA (cytosine1962-C5)-methyltransferase
MSASFSHLPAAGLYLYPQGWTDYELLDSGGGEKLERFGPYLFIRPEAQAHWPRFLEASVWQSAHGRFVASSEDSAKGGRWQLQKTLPERWEIGFDGLRFTALPTAFRHLGFFPEQSVHWRWCAGQIAEFVARQGRPPQLLNLFAYSGVASLHAAASGAEVTHLDASKKAVSMAFDNRNLSGLQEAPIRFITDDAMGFLQREARRGRQYDAIILDPPKYGRGPKGEVWQLERDLHPLLQACRALLSDSPLFVVATLYAVRLSALAAHAALAAGMEGVSGQTESGEIAIVENRPAGRAIGQALFARWLAAGYGTDQI